MARILLPLLLLALLAAPASGRPGAVTYTLALDQPNPVHGQAVTFTGTFPQDAFKQARNPQFPYNPQLEVVCSVVSPNDFIEVQATDKSTKTKLPDGSIQATSYPVVLDLAGWPAGVGATCSAITGYWTQTNQAGVVFHSVASTYFTVSP